MIKPVIEPTGEIYIFKGKQAEPIKLVIGEILQAEIMDIFPTGSIQIRLKDRVITAQLLRDFPLNKGDSVLVKVENPLPDGTIPLRVLISAEGQWQSKSLRSFEIQLSNKILELIESLFSNSSKSTPLLSKSYTDISKLLLSTPTENLSESQKSLLLQKVLTILFSSKSIMENLHELINLMEKNDYQRVQISKLKNFLIELNEQLTPEKLKRALLNTGVSYEAKLKDILISGSSAENIKNDLKALLISISKEAQGLGREEISSKANKVIEQIEGYQILSKTYQSFFTFLPLLWNEIEGGNFAYKSLKRQGKDYYSVFINLNFREGESLSFIVTKIRNNFFVTFSGTPSFLDLIRKNEKVLKECFSQGGLYLSGIKYLEKLEDLIKDWNIKEGQINIKV